VKLGTIIFIPFPYQNFTFIVGSVAHAKGITQFSPTNKNMIQEFCPATSADGKNGLCIFGPKGAIQIRYYYY